MNLLSKFFLTFVNILVSNYAMCDWDFDRWHHRQSRSVDGWKRFNHGFCWVFKKHIGLKRLPNIWNFKEKHCNYPQLFLLFLDDIGISRISCFWLQPWVELDLSINWLGLVEFFGLRFWTIFLILSKTGATVWSFCNCLRLGSQKNKILVLH